MCSSPTERMDIRNSKLFTPLELSGVKLNNRVCLSPVSLMQATPTGCLNEAAEDFYIRRAKGGTGLIIVGGHTVDSAHPYSAHGNSMDTDAVIEPYEAFTSHIHALGSKVFMQLIRPAKDDVSENADELSLAPAKFAAAARRAELAGFDGVELHAAHAYMLLGSFLSGLKNHRTDKYGGDIIGRATLLFEVLSAVRSAVSPCFPVILRMSGSEKIEGGNTLDEVLKLAPELVKAGISAFDISGGTQHEEPWRTIPRADAPFGVNIPEAEAIKDAVDVPVFVVGKINDVTMAAQCVDEGHADGVVMARALFADAELVNKALGRVGQPIRKCVACGECFKRIRGMSEQSELKALPVCKFEPNN